MTRRRTRFLPRCGLPCQDCLDAGSHLFDPGTVKFVIMRPNQADRDRRSAVREDDAGVP